MYPELENAHALQVREFTRKFIDALPASARQSVFIVDTTDLQLAEAIAFASVANFYICHHGTQQHKIGWIYDVPGVIHASPSVVKSQPAHWVQSQSEGSVLPVYVPDHLVKFVSRTTNRRIGYDDDYEFTSCLDMVDFVLDCMMPVWRAFHAATT
jgi:hypothetical protein